MAYSDKIQTSIHGRRFGLQQMSSNISGTQQSGRQMEFAVGPDSLRVDVTTLETTANSMKPYGVSMISSGSCTTSGAVFRLDPPIPGVGKTIVIQSTATGVASTFQYIITASTGGVVFLGSTWSSSFSVLATSGAAVIQLMGLTTGHWSIANTSGQFLSAATTTT